MVGVDDQTFLPEAKTSRAMLVTILYNMEDRPSSSNEAFADIPANEWYTQPIAWAVKKGIIAGYGDGTLGPNEGLTREQTAVLLYNYAKIKGYSVTPANNLDQYADAGHISPFALTALKWANAVGLINGYGNGLLDPQGGATRAQIAAILMQFCENTASPDFQ